MAAVNPTNFTSLIVDEFIQYATRHLNTITGSVTTLSLYPPIPTPSPGILIWKGYTIPPASTITSDLRDTMVANEVNKIPDDGSYQLETDPEKNAEFDESKGSRIDEGDGIDYGAKPISVNILRTPEISASTLYTPIGKIITTDKGIFLDLGGTNAFEADGSVSANSLPLGDEYYFGKLYVQEGGPIINIGLKPSIGLTRAEELRRIQFDGGAAIKFVDISKSWEIIAEQYLVKNEGFTPKAVKKDENAYRLGYGTTRIWDPVRGGPKIDPVTGKLYEARLGDTTTQENATKMLRYEILTRFKDVVVGNASYQIRQADWDKLNNVQKAGLISFAYNCGRLYDARAAAIRAGNYVEAANRTLNGPIIGSETGDVYAGLVRRRSEEAAMIGYGYLQ
jgi:GH24 family phage-related lysozyme (muramidase)